jgi:nitrite reductase/ring-hydroxylating ferredoxin subunit/uncharacterized membrane protein YgcG
VLVGLRAIDFRMLKLFISFLLLKCCIGFFNGKKGFPSIGKCRLDSRTVWTSSHMVGLVGKATLTEDTTVENMAFSWSKQWYPLAIEDDLDPTKPQLVHILGKRLVLWRDDSNVGNESAVGEWRAIDEACPHRLASLAIGKVDSKKGVISCRYHGYEFNGTGACTHIPMATTNSSAQNYRASSVGYPAQEKLGLIWVWPDDGKDRYLEAALSPLPILPEMEAEDKSGFTPWSRKEWPVDWRSMVENSMDPSHAMFLHDNTFFKSADARPMRGFQLTPYSPWEAIKNPNISDNIEAVKAGEMTGDGMILSGASNKNDIGSSGNDVSGSDVSGSNGNSDSAISNSPARRGNYGPAARVSQLNPNHSDDAISALPSTSTAISATTTNITTATSSSSSSRDRLAIDGFVMSHKGYSSHNLAMNATRAFLPPCTSVTRYSLPGRQSFLFYFVPTRPGFCTVIGSLNFNFPPALLKILKVKEQVEQAVIKVVPDMKHIFKSQTHMSFADLDQQDFSGMRPCAFEMERRELGSLASETSSSGGSSSISSGSGTYSSSDIGVGGSSSGGGSSSSSSTAKASGVWKSAYVLPTNSDAGVVTFRRWLDKWVGGVNPCITKERERLPRLTMVQLTDRWEAHSKDCVHCKRSVELTSKWAQKLSVSAIVCAALAVVSSSFQLRPTVPRVVPTTIFTILAVLSLVLRDITKKFRHTMFSYRPAGAPPSLQTSYTDLDKVWSL